MLGSGTYRSSRFVIMAIHPHIYYNHMIAVCVTQSGNVIYTLGSWLGGTTQIKRLLCASIPELVGGVNAVGCTNDPSPSRERDRAWLDSSRVVQLFWLSVLVFIAARGSKRC